MSINGVQTVSSTPEAVAVDAMGGDLGLKVQVEGAVCAKKEFGINSILVGPESELISCIESLGAKDLGIQVVHAPEVVTMEDSPVRAVRKKPNSSLCVAYNLVQTGKASSIISSGNSGAMMAAGRLICGLLPGIDRPAIGTPIPSVGNNLPSLIIDAGANVDSQAQNLVQFAVMGSVYYSSLFKVTNPKVGLLSNGTESSKGTDVIRIASQLLSKTESLNYIGYIEGRDAGTGVVNVIVCDGFVGNVLLKSMEGCVRLVYDQLKLDANKTPLGKLGMYLLQPVLKKVFQEKFDYTSIGGAPLLGLRKLAVVLHGSSGTRAVKNAINVAHRFSEVKIVDQISTALISIAEQLPDMGAQMLSTILYKEEKGNV